MVSELYKNADDEAQHRLGMLFEGKDVDSSLSFEMAERMIEMVRKGNPANKEAIIQTINSIYIEGLPEDEQCLVKEKEVVSVQYCKM